MESPADLWQLRHGAMSMGDVGTVWSAPRPPGERPLAELMVVAGLRGAGKTTFLRALSAGWLDPVIAARIPKSASSWPQVEGADHAAWLPMVAAGSLPIPNLTLHLDIASLLAGFGREALEVLRMADSVMVINLRPAAERLVAQLNQRSLYSIGRLAAGKEPSRDIWDHLARPLLPPALTRFPGGRGQAGYLDEDRLRMIALYRDAGWMARVHGEWDATVGTLAAGAGLRILDLEPRDDGQPRPMWALLRDSNDAESSAPAGFAGRL
jgi:hypothetical protein